MSKGCVYKNGVRSVVGTITVKDKNKKDVELQVGPYRIMNEIIQSAVFINNNVLGEITPFPKLEVVTSVPKPFTLLELQKYLNEDLARLENIQTHTRLVKDKNNEEKLYITDERGIELIKVNIDKSNHLKIEYAKKGAEGIGYLMKLEREPLRAAMQGVISSLKTRLGNDVTFEVSGDDQYFADILNTTQNIKQLTKPTKKRYAVSLREAEDLRLNEINSKLHNLALKFQAVENRNQLALKNHVKQLQSQMRRIEEPSELQPILDHLNKTINVGALRSRDYIAEMLVLQKEKNSLINSGTDKSIQKSKKSTVTLTQAEHLLNTATAETVGSGATLTQELQRLKLMKDSVLHFQSLDSLYQSTIQKSDKLNKEILKDINANNTTLTKPNKKEDLKNIQERRSKINKDIEKINSQIKQIDRLIDRVSQKPNELTQGLSRNMFDNLSRAKQTLIKNRDELAEQQLQLNKKRDETSQLLIHDISPLMADIQKIENEISEVTQKVDIGLNNTFTIENIAIFAKFIETLEKTKKEVDEGAIQTRISKIEKNIETISRIIPYAEESVNVFHMRMLQQLEQMKQSPERITKKIQETKDKVADLVANVANQLNDQTIEIMRQAYLQHQALHNMRLNQGKSPDLKALQEELQKSEMEMNKLLKAQEKTVVFSSKVKKLSQDQNLDLNNVNIIDKTTIQEHVKAMQDIINSTNQWVVSPQVNSLTTAKDDITSELNKLASIKSRPLSKQQSSNVVAATKYLTDINQYLNERAQELKTFKDQNIYTKEQLALIQASYNEASNVFGKLKASVDMKKNLLETNASRELLLSIKTPGISKVLELNEASPDKKAEEDKLFKHTLARQLALFYDKHQKVFDKNQLLKGKHNLNADNVHSKIMNLTTEELQQDILAVWRKNINASLKAARFHERSKKQELNNLSKSLETIEKSMENIVTGKYKK